MADTYEERKIMKVSSEQQGETKVTVRV